MKEEATEIVTWFQGLFSALFRIVDLYGGIQANLVWSPRVSFDRIEFIYLPDPPKFPGLCTPGCRDSVLPHAENRNKRKYVEKIFLQGVQSMNLRLSLLVGRPVKSFFSFLSSESLLVMVFICFSTIFLAFFRCGRENA